MNGDLIAKRDVLLALGSTPTLYDGKIELTPFEWLVPIQEGLPELKTELANLQPEDLEIGNPALEPIRTKWLGMRDSNLFNILKVYSRNIRGVIYFSIIYC